MLGEDPGSGNVRHDTNVGTVSLTGRCPRARGHTRGIIPGSFMCYYSCLWSSCFFPVAARTMAVSVDFVSPGMKRTLEAHPGATVTLQSHSSMEGRTGNSPNNLINWGIQAPTLTKFFLDAKSFNGSPLATDQVQVSYHSILKPFDFPGGSDDKESACNVGDLGSIPGLGRSLGVGNGNPLQYSCLVNSMDRGTWWATVHGVTKSWTQLSD